MTQYQSQNPADGLLLSVLQRAPEAGVFSVILTERATRAAGRISDSFAQAKPVPVSELLHPIGMLGLRACIDKPTISRHRGNCATMFPVANRREILPKLLKLPVRERARLATELVQSLDGSEDPDATAAWLEELDRRAREVISGTAKLEDWTKVRRRIELRLRAR